MSSSSADAHLLALESVIFGRTESGETVRSGALLDGWFVHRDGELIQAECLDLSGEIGATLAKAAVLNGNRAMATLRYIAPDAEERLDHMRAMLGAPDAIPAVDRGGQRLERHDGYALRRAPTAMRSIAKLARVLERLSRQASAEGLVAVTAGRAGCC